MSAYRVTRLSVTPVKGMRVQHPEAITLGPEGAEGDRDFFFADAQGRLLSVPRLGALVQFTASFDAQAHRLAIRHDDGRVCDGRITLGAGARVRRSDGREIRGNVVEGPWAAFVEDVADQPLRLIKAELPGAASDAAGVTLLGAARASASPAPRASTPAASGCSSSSRPTASMSRTSGGARRGRRGGDPDRRAVPRCAATTRDPDRGVRDLPAVQVIRAYRGLRDTFFGPGVPFGVYADVVTLGRVRVGDSLQPP